MSDLVREVVSFIHSRRGEAIIVPAMGSHGGATAEGQAAVLAEYGITQEKVGAPVLSNMETVCIGESACGVPVYCDVNAWRADYIVPLNRVKPHTQFRAPTESGLLKMLVIGFGKDRGAATIHGHGVQGLVELIPACADVFLRSGKVLFGLAVVEDGRHRTAHVRALAPGRILEEEAALLRLARDLLPRLPVDELDLLILDRMGKDISGPGMDSSVTGRIMANGVPDPPTPRTSLLAVLDLTPASHGNAVGVGLAEFISQRLAAKIDLHATYMNSIIGGFPVQGKIPMTMRDDRQILRAAAVILGATGFADCRLIHAASTLELETFLVSEAILPSLQGRPGIEMLTPPAPMAFDDEDNLKPVEHP
ncbi:MAG: hypothetical protein LBO77_03720 [Desulfovibrio sp.]|nr:hypothetical protein [Desulfovibrio sp.]